LKTLNSSMSVAEGAKQTRQGEDDDEVGCDDNKSLSNTIHQNYNSTHCLVKWSGADWSGMRRLYL
jgi:hypothetical protein